MKKLFFIATLLLAGVLGAQAQFMDKRARFGVTLDLNVAKLSGEDLTNKLGAAIGFKGNYLFTNNVFMNYGLKWSMKGFKIDGLKDFKGTAHYFDIPIHVGLRYPFGYDGSTAVYAEFGPYVGVGLAGTFEYGNGRDGDYFDDDASRFDFGLGFGVGFTYKAFDLHLGYDFGLVNVIDASDDPKNRVLYVGLGFMF
ncbi:MAG: porin family protein [Bacteroidaceae bacterium]|nr:porin family protein [Bacteroidaceae bacterium]